MQIKVMTIYVSDQDKALRFYTDVLGFQKKTDVGAGDYRWLTVVSPEAPDGIELQLALAQSPVAKAYQEGTRAEGGVAVMFNTDDVDADFDRIKKAGGQFTMEPMDVTGSRIAQLDDTVGNLVQLTQLKW
ncbi:MAG: VOC family protein [Bauldia sp.]